MGLRGRPPDGEPGQREEAENSKASGAPKSSAAPAPLPPPAAHRPAARRQGTNKPRIRLTRSRTLAEVLTDLERVHAESTAALEHLQAEQQALLIRDRVTRTWLYCMEAIIKVTAPLRQAQAAALAAHKTPPDAGTAQQQSTSAGPSSGNFELREAFLADCLAQVQALHLGGEAKQPPHSRPEGAAAAAAAAAGAESNGGIDKADGSTSTTADRGWIARVQAMCREEGPDAVVQLRMGSAADVFAKQIRALVEGSAVDLCHVRSGHFDAAGAAERLKEAMDKLVAELAILLVVNPTSLLHAPTLRLDTMQPVDRTLTAEEWTPVFTEMRLSGQQEAEVLELFSQWGPSIAACTARRAALAAEHGRLAAAAGACAAGGGARDVAALEAEEHLLEEIERAQLEFYYKLAAFIFALWVELLSPEQGTACLVAAYPYAPSLLAISEGATSALKARRAAAATRDKPLSSTDNPKKAAGGNSN